MRLRWTPARTQPISPPRSAAIVPNTRVRRATRAPAAISLQGTVCPKVAGAKSGHKSPEPDPKILSSLTPQAELKQRLVGDAFLAKLDFHLPCAESAGGAPREYAGGLDAPFLQNRRQPARCQRSTVSGRTNVRQDLQLHTSDSPARLIRVAASIWRGLMPRSLKRASCRRSTKFSAAVASRAL
jgi:hypothetical protein